MSKESSTSPTKDSPPNLSKPMNLNHKPGGLIAQGLARWTTYIKERCPLGSYLFLSLGLSLGPQTLVIPSEKIHLSSVLWGALLVFVFFVVLRFMDEVKDYKKDIIAHPERPLPRGLIKVGEAKIAIKMGIVTMLLLGAIPILFSLFASGQKVGEETLNLDLISRISGISNLEAWLTHPSHWSSLFYFGTTFYLILMYFEFFCGRWLEKMPIVYALSHQVILFVLCASTASVPWIFSSNLNMNPSEFSELIPSQMGLAEIDQTQYIRLISVFLAAMSIFPAFFAYEIGRKMSPLAHPALNYYRLTHGLNGSRCILSILIGVQMLGLYASSDFFSKVADYNGALGLIGWILLSLTMMTITFVGVWTSNDEKFKRVELLSTLNLTVAIYSPVLVLISK